MKPKLTERSERKFTAVFDPAPILLTSLGLEMKTGAWTQTFSA
jgi:hypothetical protein